MTDWTSDRRSILAVGGLAVTAGLAGCAAFRDSTGVPGDRDPPEDHREGHPPDDPLHQDADDDGDDDDNDDNGEVQSVGASAASEEEIEAHLEDANGYDGEFVDLTGAEEVSVDNGVGPNNLTFDPPAIRVSEGAVVTWTWQSSGHTVTHDNGDEFDSGLEGEGFVFSLQFEEAGEFLYSCTPHIAQGQLGAVIVE